MIKRRKHYIRRNTSSRRPQQIAWIGLDTDKDGSGVGAAETFRSAFVLLWRDGYDYDVNCLAEARHNEPEYLWLWLACRAHSRTRLIVVAENPERLIVVARGFERLKADGWRLDFPISTSRLSLLPWRKDDRTLLLIAHRNIFNFVPPPEGDAESQAREMARLWLDLLALYDERDLGDFRLTLGSQAMQIYRHRFIDHPILIHAVPHIDALERQACRGAFYQPLFYGVAPPGRYHYVDVNGMYPWCMATFLLPWRLVGSAGEMPVGTLEKKMNQHLAVALVRLRTDEPRYPLLLNDRTIYPVGEFETALTTPDLWYALEHNHIREVRAAAWYDGARLFRRFVETLWQWRREYLAAGDIIKAKLCKAWSVALYGRWGAWRYERVHEADVPEDEIWAGTIADLDTGQAFQGFALDGKMWSNRRSEATYDGFPAIMAHIAAYGRRRIFEIIKAAGEGNTFVALADGLIVNDAGLTALEQEIDPERLGALKLKRSADYLEIRSDVEFVLGEHRWLPGVKQDAMEIDDGVFIVDLEPRLGLLLQRGNLEQYSSVQRTLYLERAIRCGIPLPSGWIAPHAVGAPLPIPPQPFSRLLA